VASESLARVVIEIRDAEGNVLHTVEILES
jgi:hypothetical protein